MKGTETREQALFSTTGAVFARVAKRINELPEKGFCTDIEQSVLCLIREESQHLIEAKVGIF